jgi:glycosyltransferase involved in cell wall biosynthesis
VDTFIRGLFKWAPDDLEFELVGMTTDAGVRPIHCWTRCDLGRREFNFLPLVCVADAGQRTRIPLTVRYTYALLRHSGNLRQGFDIFDFHRVEPALPFLCDERPKNAFFHTDMGVIRHEAKADILWRHMPAGYFAIESFVVSRLDSGWCVREEGTRALRVRNPAKAQALSFVCTWVDTEIFSPAAEPERAQARLTLSRTYGLPPESAWVVSVGRLDTSKDPALVLKAVAQLVAQGQRLCWLVVGDGVLRPSLQREVQQSGLGANVVFLGLRSAAEIARIMSACDVFALSSAYEGMPMALLEALGCGLPVATTDVGEVRRVIRPGVNGEVAEDRNVEAYSACLARVIARRECYRGAPATDAIADFRPHIVLQPVYENYRELGQRWRKSCAA